MLDLSHFTGFDWDEANETKSWTKHGVIRRECEEVFFNQPLVLAFDAAHLQEEDRYFVLGRTDQGRRLFVVFTPREDKIRIISARDMTKMERRFYPA